MTTNLLNLFKDQLSDNVLSNVSNLIGGEKNETIQKGLMAAAPALLGGMMDKASTSEGAASIFSSLGDGSELGNLTNALSAGGEESEGSLNKGLDFVKNILGDKASGVIDLVSSVSGMGKGSSSSILSVAGSLLGGVLGKQKSSGLDLGGFVGMLSGQGSFLDKFAPAGLTSLLGLSSFSGISDKLGGLATGALGFAGNTGKAALDGAGNIVGGATNLAANGGNAVIGYVGNTGKAAFDGAGKVVGGAADLAGSAGKAGGSLIKKILPWAIGIIGLLLAFFLIKGCDSDKSIMDNVKNAANETTGAISNTANSAVDAAGNVVNKTVDVAGNVVDATNNAIGNTVDAAGNAVDATGKAIGNTVDAAGKVLDAAGNTISNVAGGIVDASGNVVNAFGETIGNFFSSDLPNGTTLSIPEGGFESNFLSYINDGKFEAGKYYAFDRLYFKTGSSNLDANSTNQIENVASIMKAYPKVNILFRGHTDNTGSVEGNKTLSASRALSVKNKLVEMGVAASRISTKGMGSIDPIADNATPEGRSKNRRIDVSVEK
ncbi:OmpA family protein [Olleya sp. HaHaR_3_96]|uniref:OmpA family protein n=1 Tax=Olleya sp. HaHaR_3_96 TaxID=2745560 RepID=UPI001C4E818A|nr:OmpA family protein [Olleya sp. HaHaR_3_96]QXP58639.1 OmpA family protein [Olleya sp. HaHaR_3_96]